jgi:hypothetical protein
MLLKGNGHKVRKIMLSLSRTFKPSALALVAMLSISACGSSANPSAVETLVSKSPEISKEVLMDDKVMRASCAAHGIFIKNLSAFGLESLAGGELPPTDGSLLDGAVFPTTGQLLDLPIFLGAVAEQVGILDDATPSFARATYKEWLNIGSELGEWADSGGYPYEAQEVVLESLDVIDTNCTEVFGEDYASQ